MAKKKQSQTPAAKRARERRAAAAASEGPGLTAAGEKGVLPASAKPTKTEEDNAAEQSANAASEVSRRRHEPGAPDPEGDGPDVGRVDNRVDTSFETQQMPRPANPVQTNATAARIAPENAGSDEDPLTVETGFPKKVRAIKTGYFNHSRRRAGDVFVIFNSMQFSKHWMEYAGSSDPEQVTSGQEELNKMRRQSLEDQLAKKKAGTGDENVLGA